jgi:hypothetical protein
MALGFSTTLRNNQLDQITSAAGAAAKLQFYDGGSTPLTLGQRPATGLTPLTGYTKLAELTCNATFAPSATGGVLTLNAVTSAAALATGTAIWFRITTSGGTFVMDGTVGQSGQDLNMSTTSFVQSATISVTSFTITAGNP